MFYEEDEEDEKLSHRERMLKELYKRRSKEDLNLTLIDSLSKMRNSFQEE